LLFSVCEVEKPPLLVSEVIHIDIEKPLNEFFAISAGIGSYSGEVKHSIKSEEYYGGTSDLNYTSDSEDLERDFGYKIGVSTNYRLSKNLKFLGRVNYRVLELDIENTSESIDLDGFEFKAGLTYKF